MQALLFAVGVGASTSIPLAAAINWVLKDGLGQVLHHALAIVLG